LLGVLGTQSISTPGKETRMTSQRPTLPIEILEYLPDEEREVLVLSSFYGLARDEVAGIIGESVAAVDGLMRRARADLHVLLASAQSIALAA
jgi:DNA-directed RNA polymerase specialized sigma24 family protein